MMTITMLYVSGHTSQPTNCMGIASFLHEKMGMARLQPLLHFTVILPHLNCMNTNVCRCFESINYSVQFKLH